MSGIKQKCEASVAVGQLDANEMNLRKLSEPVTTRCSTNVFRRCGHEYQIIYKPHDKGFRPPGLI